MADNMSIDKNDPVRDESGDESGTSSSRDAEAQANNTNTANSTQEAQQPKRKGGRKPIYATSEERKQRNRQAQAAFRERRTEYIKQLEETIRVHETNLHNLQTAHRHAADECLMLRYKNSLLERILLEKQIDVQAELQAKTGSPNLGPSHMPPNLVQPPPIQRSLLNRHHSRRSNSALAPKAEPGIPLAPLPAPLVSPHVHSTTSRPPPKTNQPTPPSHAASPTGTGTISYGSQQAPSPATSGSEHMTSHVRHRMKAPPIPAPANMSNPLARHMQMGALQQQQQQQQQHQQQQRRPGRGSVGAAPPYYAAQAYQNHIEQLDSSIVLEQEYDAAADMMEDSAEQPDTPSGPGPYPGAPYGADSQPMTLPSPITAMPPNGHGHGHGGHGHSNSMDGVQHQQPPPQHSQHQPQPQQHDTRQQQGNYPSMTQLLDPGLDFDPFGLSASMQFPTQFSFDTSNMR